MSEKSNASKRIFPSEKLAKRAKETLARHQAFSDAFQPVVRALTDIAVEDVGRAKQATQAAMAYLLELNKHLDEIGGKSAAAVGHAAEAVADLEVQEMELAHLAQLVMMMHVNFELDPAAGAAFLDRVDLRSFADGLRMIEDARFYEVLEEFNKVVSERLQDQ